MITKSAQTLEYSSGWQKSMANAIREPAELLRMLNLPETLLAAAETAARQFPLRVPLPYLKRIEKGNPDDPLLRQILPMSDEMTQNDRGQRDPVGDMAAMASPGVLQKYHGRALLITTGACAINCRYCFRRHFPYNDANPISAYWPQTLDYLKHNTNVSEIILSGGDPLNLSDTRLAHLISDLAHFDHLHTLRIHTRLPTVLPERVTEGLCNALDSTRLQKVVVLHINHPNEIDDEVMASIQRLRQTGAILLNQSVLLQGVNDDTKTLESLSRRLFNAGILPYYLHQLDPVTGAMHFEVPVERGQLLLEQLQKKLPGYLVPRYVKEIPGSGSKILL